MSSKFEEIVNIAQKSSLFFFYPQFGYDKITRVVIHFHAAYILDGIPDSHGNFM